MTPIHDTILEDEMRSSYIDYAMSVIIGRALPDVRDGLKPVQRRILYSMRELGLTPQKPFRKSATVVGDVIGKYHPHGDQAVYDALVRMAQDFALRYPLIDGQGNFGSIDGDPPAAYRYTEARLSRIAMEMLESLDEDTVDFVPNFDGRLKEPVVLPSKIPNLLLNGSSGIAVGMATNVPPHNLGEVIDALNAMIDNPDITIDEIMNYIKGPDFPTGAIIMGRSGIKEAYKTGRGKIIVRARVHIEEKRGKKKSIVVTEIPYQVTKTTIIEKIVQLVRNKKIDGIQDLRDESDRRGIRLVVELKKSADPEIVLNQLYKHTPLQDTFGAYLLVLVDGEPKILNIKELLQEFLKHRENVIRRRTQFRLKKAEERAHILEGFKKALDHIDEIIEIIKASEDQKTAKENLIKRFEFTEVQAQAILDMRLGNLTRLDRNKIETEYEELIKQISWYKEILENRKLLLEEIRKELLEIKKKYGDKRRTEISDEEVREFNIEELIPPEDVIVTATSRGYVKRTLIKNYKKQGRGGVGRSAINTYDDDFPVSILMSNNHDLLLIFTDRGRALAIKTYEIPEGSLQSRGRPLNNIANIGKDERIITAVPLKTFEDSRFVVLATKFGIIKKTKLVNFKNAGRRGIIAINLQKGDRVVDVVTTEGNDQLILAKSSGYAIRFKETELNEYSRYAKGVKGTTLKKGEHVVSMVKVEPRKKVLTITENGYGKKFDPEEIRLTRRGAMGVTIQKITPKTGALKRVGMVDGRDDIILLTKAGSVIRLKSSEISSFSRYAMGVRLMKVKENDKIVDAEIIPYEESLEEALF
ncbi:MAG TPA: DNA gyrase subunit A [candidate division WOR-3 bacterium]|uniref:DNA gyrase subunit A n=1 Tax=candidate division WOR-3 bacterium TaxID=2052148 RepID=A0A7V5HNF2_UNCW3|nr:DNA gyrase subunit A [candidate division WOR-3 bacterium]